jgi:uncharacterized protein
MMSNPFLEIFEKLARQYGLAAVYAFGSMGRQALERASAGEGFSNPPESDLDIGILPKPGRRVSARERVELAAALEDLFNVRRVDLVVLNEAPPFLALEVVRGELLLATDEDFEAEFELYVLRRAGDQAPLERERRAIVLGEDL